MVLSICCSTAKIQWTVKPPRLGSAHPAVAYVQASMLEIYNEEYKDLLGKALPAGKKHQVPSNTASSPLLGSASALCLMHAHMCLMQPRITACFFRCVV